jgi:hypothetical protein
MNPCIWVELVADNSGYKLTGFAVCEEFSEGVHVRLSVVCCDVVDSTRVYRPVNGFQLRT